MERRTFVHSSMAAALAIPVVGRDPLAGLLRVATSQPGDIEAVRGDGTKVMLDEAGIRDLAKSLRGRLLLADSDGYDTARMVLNPTIDRHPALIAQPSSAAEVQHAVSYARE